MLAIPSCHNRQPQAASAAKPRRGVKARVAALALALPLSACGPTSGVDAAAASQIAVERAWSRETAPGQDAGGAFLTIVNSGAGADRLVGGATPAAADVQIHTVDMTGGVMRMRRLAEGLEIPAGETVTLEPGGYHFMLMGLHRPFARGKTVPLTLEFEKAGSVEVALAIQPIGAKTPAETHHD